MALSPPLGIRLLPSCTILDRTTSYKIFTLIFTFVIYTSYHLSRKPISVVKNALFHNSCHKWEPQYPENSTACDWAPFDGSDHDSLLGSLDLAYLFAYAVGMFLSGHIAERMNLRHFLTLGMLLSGITTAAFGFGYFFKIHVLWFYILVQVVGGMVQASGWPSVVTCVGNWWGKGKRGFIMGVWNSHTSVGNITGSLIAGIWVNHAWGWSFAVPGMIIGGLGIIVFLFLVTEPSVVGCEEPDQPDPDELVTSDSVHIQNDSGPVPNDDYNSATSVTPLLKRPVPKSEEKAIPLYRAVLIPGVLEFSLCLFFAKLVSYTFLFWLPKYIHQKNPSFNAEESADLSTLFDVGGILGGITAGIISDYTGARASTCAVMLILAAPMMYILNVFGAIDYAHTVGLLIACGYLVNGPYALITTAVSADLGTHKSLQGNSKALATVTAIIDGTGSIGAAIGPLLTGVLWKYGTMAVFWMLIGADIAALIFLTRLVIKEIRASRFCSPPLLIDDIVVDNTDSTKIEKSEHF